MSVSDLEQRFAWGSPRLQQWAAATFTLDLDAQTDVGELAQLYAEQRQAVHPLRWPALFDFEERFGGLKPRRGQMGISWLRKPRQFDGNILRADLGFRTSDDEGDRPIPPEVAGRWLGLVCEHDLDYADFIDEDGAIFNHSVLTDRAYPAAGDAARYFEKRALRAERDKARGTSTGDFFLEVDGWIGEALARAACVPLVPEATDAVTRWFWDGVLAIEERPRFGDPEQRGTRISSGDLARLSAVARMGWELLDGDRVMRVIGWPSEHTYDFGRRLDAEHPGMKIVVATTYP